jgi:hypothetical protein
MHSSYGENAHILVAFSYCARLAKTSPFSASFGTKKFFFLLLIALRAL